jgi:hypothetical protein
MTVTAPINTFRPSWTADLEGRDREGSRGLRTFVRRSPLSAFWGLIAAANVFMPSLHPICSL